MPPPARLAVLLALVALLLVPAAAARSEAAERRVTVSRASFDTSLAGWRGYNASVSLVAAGKRGRAARVRYRGRASSYSLYPAPRPVASTEARARYVASAAVRSARRERVCLRVREWAGGRVVGAAARCVVATRAWRTIDGVSYRARGAGHSLDAYVYSLRPRRGDAFDVDAITLARLDAAPAPARPTTPRAPVTAALRATATDHAHVELGWSAVPGAERYRVLRDGLTLAVTESTGYVDALLWPRTRYEYRVEALGPGGNVLVTRTDAATTEALPASGFPRPFARGSFWNTPVGARPTHPRNAALSRYFVSKAVNPNLTLRRWGVSVAEARPGDPVFQVPCTRYACTLGDFGAFRIPLTAAADPAGDGHLAVVDPAAGREWGMWQARRTAGGWSASAGAAVSLAGDGVARANTASGNAANFPLLGGLIRPEELLQGRIDHALVFGLPGIGRGRPVCPATHNASTTSDPDALREGQLLQLDPALDVDGLDVPGWQKTIMRALQTYGMYLRDNSGSLALYAENPIGRGYDAWAKVGLPGGASASLAGIPWNRFRVVAAPDC